LYIAKNSRPPAFCYVRGASDEWYANKRINDLVIRIGNWLRDAATGELSTNGEQFDPLRLEGYSGSIIYDYDTFAKIVKEKQGFDSAKSFAMSVFEGLNDGETNSFKFLKIVTLNNLKETIDEFKDEIKKGKVSSDKRNLHYGYVLWSNSEKTFEHYSVDLPKTWEGFKCFCKSYEIDLTELENFIAIYDSNCFVHFPIIVALKRPSQVIGFSSDIEFVNFRFRIDTGDVNGGKINNDIQIAFQSHNQPLTISLASRISGVNFPKRNTMSIVVFGCGALGSKIVMQLARSGQAKFILIDPDNLLPHNLVRHALLSSSLGTNKAIALKEEIMKLYPTGDVMIWGIANIRNDIFYREKALDAFDWIFDFTASESFFNKLTLAKGINTSRVCSASISDFGNLGIMYIEGENRNPRIDDLQMSLHSLCHVEKKISDWLIREEKAISTGNLTVNVGVGCNSETTILSDSKLSSHASYFSGALTREITDSKNGGKVFLNRITESPNYAIETQMYDVAPFDIFNAVNDPSWTLRFKAGIVIKMKEQMINAKKKETGGILVGAINLKTKTIHVIDLIDAPSDSKANAVCFYRGFHGLPKKIDNVTHSSGGQLGYIGEWHSHPHGPNELSQIDFDSVTRFKREFKELQTPLPVFLTVITPSSFLPHVF
ncbi:MAG: ThiF family adenylyltransferase, partial [Cyclobacteriaceae bacterium]